MIIANSGLIFLATHNFNFLWYMENIGTFSLGFNCIFEDLKSRLIVEICRNEQNSLREKNKQGRDWNLWKVGGWGGGWVSDIIHRCIFQHHASFAQSSRSKWKWWLEEVIASVYHLISNQIKVPTVQLTHNHLCQTWKSYSCH